VRWPGQLKAGTVSDVPVIGSDIFPTVCQITGVPVPSDRVIDGANLLPALADKPVDRPRPLYWRCAISPDPLKTAMRIGDWKILADEALTQFELYNVQQDWQEKNNLAAAEPEKFAQMKAELIKLNTEIEREGPTWWKDYNHGGKNAPKKNPTTPKKGAKKKE
jgi:arylsulfatase A-like enzyme